MLNRIATAVESLALALWVGAMAGFAFLFAPAAGRIVSTRDMNLFADLIGSSIARTTSFGGVCGAIAIVAALVRARRAGERGATIARVALVGVALAASAYEMKAVIPAMAQTAAQIPGAVDSVPKTDPRRIAYGIQHERSTRVYGIAFLAVVAAVVVCAVARPSVTE